MTISGSVEVMPAGADLFASGCEALVSPVDCSGAQGKGLALKFRRRHPDVCAQFKRQAQRGDVRVGECHVYDTTAGHAVWFVATKEHWSGPSRLQWIHACMINIGFMSIDTCAKSIAIPALGCGEGGLAWADVLPLEMAAAERMASTGVKVLLYLPHEDARRRR